MDRAQISRFEGGADARLSTWQRLYAALGLELLLVPACGLSLEALEEKLESRRPPGHWRLTPVRPRRIWPEDRL